MNAVTHPSKTKILEAAVKLFRTSGYTNTSIDDLCREARLTKGGFFHYFKGKEELAIAAARHWTTTTDALFADAPYQQIADPLQKLLAYIDFRRELLRGQLPQFTCLLGTIVQETYHTNPAIRAACDESIKSHVADVAKMIAAAKLLYQPNAPWSADSLALHTQAVIQGAFILAKAGNGPGPAIDSLNHLRRYIELLFQLTKED